MGMFNLFSKPVISWLNKESSVRSKSLSDFERIKHELRICDVILVEGRSKVSDVIRITTQSPWTHAGLYIGRLHDVEDPDLRKIIQHQYQGDPSDRLVIESLLGHGTVIRNLENYQQDHLRICRPARLGVTDSQLVVRYAVSRLGVDYDVRQIFDLMRFLFPWVFLPRRWRSSLFRHNPGPSTRTVCSTMIAEAFAFVQFPILPLVKPSDSDGVQLFRRNPKLCTPSDFDYSPYFKIIKYPFVDIHYHHNHHLLPWEGHGELDEDESDLYMASNTAPSKADVEDAINDAIARTEAVTDENTDKTLEEPLEEPQAMNDIGVDSPELAEAAKAGNDTTTSIDGASKKADDQNTQVH